MRNFHPGRKLGSALVALTVLAGLGLAVAGGASADPGNGDRLRPIGGNGIHNNGSRPGIHNGWDRWRHPRPFVRPRPVVIVQQPVSVGCADDCAPVQQVAAPVQQVAVDRLITTTGICTQTGTRYTKFIGSGLSCGTFGTDWWPSDVGSYQVGTPALYGDDCATGCGQTLIDRPVEVVRVTGYPRYTRGYRYADSLDCDWLPSGVRVVRLPARYGTTYREFRVLRGTYHGGPFYLNTRGNWHRPGNGGWHHPDRRTVRGIA